MQVREVGPGKVETSCSLLSGNQPNCRKQSGAIAIVRVSWNRSRERGSSPPLPSLYRSHDETLVAGGENRDRRSISSMALAWFFQRAALWLSVISCADPNMPKLLEGHRPLSLTRQTLYVLSFEENPISTAPEACSIVQTWTCQGLED